MALPRPDGPLDQLMNAALLSPGRYEVCFPDEWQQGRGTFGGLVLGAMVRAMEAFVGGDGRTLRSLTAELCGPTSPGPAEVSVEGLRAGNKVTTVAARLVQDGAVQAHAVGVFAQRRGEADSRVYLRPPARGPWERLPLMPMDTPLSPPFARHWEFRNEGPLPFQGGQEPWVQGWIRPRNPGVVRDAAWAVACADAWWPAHFSIAEGPRPVGTIAFSFELLADLDGLTAAPLYFVGRELARHDGYSVEARELWREDGRLLALNQQTFVLIR